MADRISVDIAKGILRAFFDGEWRCSDEDVGVNGIKINDAWPCADDLEPNVVLINGKPIHLYLVGQTKSYAIESERGHIFSPNFGYPNMRKVNGKDIIFSYQNGMIKSINVSLESAEETYGARDGLRIDCFYSVLSTPLDIAPLRPRLAGYMPFGPTGNLPQRGYIHPLHSYAARLMLDGIKRSGNRPR